MKKLIYLFILFTSYCGAFAMPDGFSFDPLNLGASYPAYYQNKTIFASAPPNYGIRVLENDSVKFIQIPKFQLNENIVVDTLLYNVSIGKGIQVLNLNTYKIVKTIDTGNSDLRNNSLASFAKDKDNNIWFAYNESFGKWIGKFDGEKVINYKMDDSLALSYAPSPIIIDDDNNIWFRSSYSIIKFDGKNFQEFNYKNSTIREGEYPYSMAYSKKWKEIWVSCKVNGPYNDTSLAVSNKNRIYRIKGDKWTEFKEIYPYSNPTPKNSFIDISESRDGDMVILSDYKNKLVTQVVIYDTNNVIKKINVPGAKIYDKSKSGSNEMLRASLLPNNKLYLMGEEYIIVDLNKYSNSLDSFIISSKNTNWSFYARDNEIRNKILDIKEYKGKLIAIGYSGIDIFDGVKWYRIDEKSSSIPKKFFTIRNAELLGNKIYAATASGLFTLNLDSLNDVKYFDASNSNLKDCWHNNIIKDNYNNLWICTDSSELVKYDGNTFTHIPIPADLPIPNGTNLKAIAVDKDNNIFYSTQFNIVKYDGSSWTLFDTTNSNLAKQDHIQLLYYSKSRNEILVFVSEELNWKANRLLRYKNGVWGQIKFKDTSEYYQKFGPLFVNATEDKNGNLYFALKNMTEYVNCDSMFVLSGNDGWSTIQIDARIFDTYRFNYVCLFIDSSNKLWVGGNEAGLAKYDLNTLDVIDTKTEEHGFMDLWIFSVYPNPMSKTAKISFYCSQSYLDDLKIRVYDILGKEIGELNGEISYNPQNGNASVEISCANLPKGYFLLNLSSKNESRTKAIVIE